MRARISTLDTALLGILRTRPMSGYALRRVFVETPLGIYSNSPGAIYPALKKIARLGLISGAIRTGKTRRPTETFSLTPAGAGELKRALAAPPTLDDIARRMPELALRFALMDRVLPRARIVAFLSDLERKIRMHVAKLKEYRRRNADRFLPCGRLAFESGIDDYENRALWARRAAARLAASPQKGA